MQKIAFFTLILSFVASNYAMDKAEVAATPVKLQDNANQPCPNDARRKRDENSRNVLCLQNKIPSLRKLASLAIEQQMNNRMITIGVAIAQLPADATKEMGDNNRDVVKVNPKPQVKRRLKFENV